MQTVSLTWQHSGELAGVLAVASTALRAVPQRRVRQFAPFLFEAAIIGVLYAMWQLAGEWSVMGTSDAMARARWIRHFDEHLPLPTEQTLNAAILHWKPLVQVTNLYYDNMHFTMMFVFLIWLFWRHRHRYSAVRTTMAWTTFFCLLIQLIPVAPPRMLPGFVDTAMLYHQSVYSNGLAVDQLSAMPSVHVAWAMVIGYYTATTFTHASGLTTEHIASLRRAEIIDAVILKERTRALALYPPRALDQVRADDLKVVAQCEFVKAFVGKNAAYQDLLA